MSCGTSAKASPVFSMSSAEVTNKLTQKCLKNQKRLNNVITARYSVMTLRWAAKNQRKRDVARVSVAQRNDSL